MKQINVDTLGEVGWCMTDPDNYTDYGSSDTGGDGLYGGGASGGDDDDASDSGDAVIDEFVDTDD